MNLSVAVIGTGNPASSDGYAMAYRHAKAYQRLASCELVGCADIVPSNAVAFAETFDIDPDGVFKSYERMLEDVAPTIVSVCTPPTTHAEIVITAAAHECVRAIHCEKPMAATWGECTEMVNECTRCNVQLTFNHQRRFAAPFREAKRLLDSGSIGPLNRIEIGGSDLYDYGTHLFDLCGMYTQQTPIEWVIGQVEHRDASMMYGLPQERQALLHWRYNDDVDGIASTGAGKFVEPHIRLIGDDGTIEVGATSSSPLRIKSKNGNWRTVDTGRDGVWRAHPNPVDRVAQRIPIGPDRLLRHSSYVDRAINDIVGALEGKFHSELRAENAIQSTEVIFAGWESARRGGRVTLPLQIDDNPLRSLVEERKASPIAERAVSE